MACAWPWWAKVETKGPDVIYWFGRLSPPDLEVQLPAFLAESAFRKRRLSLSHDLPCGCAGVSRSPKSHPG